jgi:carbonic anhydrase
MHTQVVKPGVLAALMVLLCSLTFAEAQSKFQYSDDTGPGYWFELDPAWTACAGGPAAQQSPIDVGRARVDPTLRRLALHTVPTTIDIFNNGHTIEQRYEGTGSLITFDGTVYDLVQFHFHTLSEHAVDGRRGAMELHAVFKEAGGSSNLVIGQFFEVGGRRSAFLQTLISAGLPEKDGDATTTGQSIDLADVLTNTSSYYTYGGSLTTPPCTEGVTWVVLKASATLSQSQYDAFRGILGNNFRPLQKSNGRLVRTTPGRPQGDRQRP